MRHRKEEYCLRMNEHAVLLQVQKLTGTFGSLGHSKAPRSELFVGLKNLCDRGLQVQRKLLGTTSFKPSSNREASFSREILYFAVHSTSNVMRWSTEIWNNLEAAAVVHGGKRRQMRFRREVCTGTYLRCEVAAIDYYNISSRLRLLP
jgi:hypothetical protein